MGSGYRCTRHTPHDCEVPHCVALHCRSGRDHDRNCTEAAVVGGTQVQRTVTFPNNGPFPVTGMTFPKVEEGIALIRALFDHHPPSFNPSPMVVGFF